jgi:hypothetical protein
VQSTAARFSIYGILTHLCEIVAILVFAQLAALPPGNPLLPNVHFSTMKLPLVVGAAIAALPLLTAPVLGQTLSTNDDGSLGVVLNSGGSTTSAAGSLTTLFASNNGFAGNMFDITATADLEITAIDINVSSAGTLAEVDVWYRVGTSVGFEGSSAGWTMLGSYSGTSAGQDLPTFIDMSGNGMTFVGGQSYGMYVDLTSYSTQSIRYTNGLNTYSNADLSLTTNAGKGSGFSGSTFSPREWNGTIYYDNAGGGLALAVTGTVGSGAPLIFDVTGGTADGPIAYCFSVGTGAHSVLNPITGNMIVTGLSSARFTVETTHMADAAGSTSYSRGVAAAAAGMVYVQVFDLTTDAASNVVGL